MLLLVCLQILELTRQISAFHFRLSGLREAQRILERLDLKNRLASQIRMQLKAVKSLRFEPPRQMLTSTGVIFSKKAKIIKDLKFLAIFIYLKSR